MVVLNRKSMSKQAKEFILFYFTVLFYFYWILYYSIFLVPPNITYLGAMNRNIDNQIIQLNQTVIVVEEASEIQLQCDSQTTIPLPSYNWEKLNPVSSLYEPLRTDLIKVYKFFKT